jgi:putative oxidoreductase
MAGRKNNQRKIHLPKLNILYMKKILFSTTNSYAPLALRFFLASVLFPHGAQKLFGWFNGFGFNGTMHYFTDQVGVPPIVGFAVIITEFFGPIFLLLGFATRLWSLGIVGVMVGVIATTFNQYFFMNWFGAQKTEGFEFFLLAIGMSLSLVISGSGKMSIDAQLRLKPKIASIGEKALAA